MCGRYLRRSDKQPRLELLALLRPFPADLMQAHEAHPDA